MDIEAVKMLLSRIWDDYEAGLFEKNYDKYLALYEGQMAWLNEEASSTKIPIARIEITDDMAIAHALCDGNSDCAECPCCIGTDGCVFDHVTE